MIRANGMVEDGSIYVSNLFQVLKLTTIPDSFFDQAKRYFRKVSCMVALSK